MAKDDGGAIKYVSTKFYSDNTTSYLNNKASYGNDIASYPKSLNPVFISNNDYFN